MVAALLKWHGGLGNKRAEVRTDDRELENWATEDLQTVRGPSPRQRVGMICSLNFTSMWFTPLGS